MDHVVCALTGRLLEGVLVAPPFPARTLIESATARDRSIWLITPRRCKNAWCSRFHHPACVHSVNADARRPG
jgi:hypothetical protein